MIPSTLYIGLFITAFGFVSGFGLGSKLAQREVHALRMAHAEALATQARDAQVREAKARAEERRTTHRIMETADAAQIQAADARRSAAAAAHERDRLRDAYVEFASRVSQSAEAAPAASSSPSAAGSGLVLTRLFDGADALLRSCAAALDQARIAGLACERSYDSLSPTLTGD